MSSQDCLEVINSSIDEVSKLVAGVDTLSFNPEILKHIDEIEGKLLQVELTIDQLNSIPSPVKDGLHSTLKKVHDSLKLIKIQYSSPLDVDGAIERSGIGGLPIIELEEFTLNPSTKEVIVDGRGVRLPPAEFKVLFSLASRCGQAVHLGTSHSLLTRLTNIRKQVPLLKGRIESIGSGTYQLNCKNKQK